MVKNFSRNIVGGVASSVLSLLISLFLTPFIIDRLGVAAYSVWPISNSIANYIGIFSNSITISFKQHVTYAFKTGNYEESKKYFASGLVMIIFIVCVLMVMGAIISMRIESFLDIPTKFIEQAQFCFLFIIISSGLSVIRGALNLAQFITEKFYWQKIQDIIQNLSRVSFIVALFYFWKPSLEFLGISSLLSSIIGIVISIFLFKKLLPEFSIKKKMVNKRFAVKVGQTGFWMVFSSIGAFVILNVELFFCSSKLGAEKAGIYGAIFILPNFVRIFFLYIISTFNPKIIGYIAKKDYSGLCDFIKVIFQFSVLILGVFTMGYVVFGREFLGLWLGEVFSKNWRIGIVMCLSVMITAPFQLLNGVLVAQNRAKTVGAITFVSGILSVGIILFFLKMQLGVYGIAFGAFCALLCRNILFVFFLRKQISFKEYLKPFVLISLLFMFLTMVLLLVKNFDMGLIVSCVIFTLVCLFVTNELIKNKNVFKA